MAEPDRFQEKETEINKKKLKRAVGTSPQLFVFDTGLSKFVISTFYLAIIML